VSTARGREPLHERRLLDAADARERLQPRQLAGLEQLPERVDVCGLQVVLLQVGGERHVRRLGQRRRLEVDAGRQHRQILGDLPGVRRLERGGWPGGRSVSGVEHRAQKFDQELQRVAGALLRRRLDGRVHELLERRLDRFEVLVSAHRPLEVRTEHTDSGSGSILRVSEGAILEALHRLRLGRGSCRGVLLESRCCAQTAQARFGS